MEHHQVMSVLSFVIRIAITVLVLAGPFGSVLRSPGAARGNDITLPDETRFRAVVTAYSSSPDETWGDPLVTASGRPVADGVVACPRRFSFGMKFRIGHRVYTCWDRLHPKYDHRFDVWKASKPEALEFGRKQLIVEVL